MLIDNVLHGDVVGARLHAKVHLGSQLRYLLQLTLVPQCLLFSCLEMLQHRIQAPRDVYEGWIQCGHVAPVLRTLMRKVL